MNAKCTAMELERALNRGLVLKLKVDLLYGHFDRRKISFEAL